MLEFAKVNFEGGGETSIRMRDFSARVAAGELIEVELQRHHDPRDLSLSMLGLDDLQSGAIHFQGVDWLGSDYAKQFEMRSRIGRVFAGSAWVQSLTVRDNLQLSMLHHGVDTAAAESEVQRWVGRLAGTQLAAVRYSLDQRPSVVEPSVLQLCQLVRAVCNDPILLILERPLKYMQEERYGDFVAVIDELRSSGTAVLFFSGDRDEYELSFQSPVAHWKVVRDTLSTVGGPSR